MWDGTLGSDRRLDIENQCEGRRTLEASQPTGAHTSKITGRISGRFAVCLFR